MWLRNIPVGGQAVFAPSCQWTLKWLPPSTRCERGLQVPCLWGRARGRAGGTLVRLSSC